MLNPTVSESEMEGVVGDLACDASVFMDTDTAVTSSSLFEQRVILMAVAHCFCFKNTVLPTQNTDCQVKYNSR